MTLFGIVPAADELEMPAEARLRILVAAQLAVSEAELTAETSLVEDLAADSLDLAELTVAIEMELGVTLAEHDVVALRTYRDLVCAVRRAARDPGAVSHGDPPLLVRARVTTTSGASSPMLDRTLFLTPYAAELVAEDALSVGAPARLELTVPAATPPDVVGWLAHRFATLRRRGVEVDIRRGSEGRGWAAD